MREQLFTTKIVGKEGYNDLIKDVLTMNNFLVAQIIEIDDKTGEDIRVYSNLIKVDKGNMNLFNETILPMISEYVIDIITLDSNGNEMAKA